MRFIRRTVCNTNTNVVPSCVSLNYAKIYEIAHHMITCGRTLSNHAAFYITLLTEIYCIYYICIHLYEMCTETLHSVLSCLIIPLLYDNMRTHVDNSCRVLRNFTDVYIYIYTYIYCTCIHMYLLFFYIKCLQRGLVAVRNITFGTVMCHYPTVYCTISQRQRAC